MTGAEGWTVEGVARCPDCCRYFDIEDTTLPDLEKVIEAHDCAPEEMRYMPWQI